MKILVLAGGSDQIALIKELKRRGHDTILVDYFENPPAKPYVDEHIVASTLDVDRVREIAEQKQVELICTACTDQALLTVANVSEQLGLPCYISYKNALNVTNKSYMKRRMLESGIPTARFVILDSREDISAADGLDFPLVVKPVDCNSSKGVVKVSDKVQLKEALANAIGFSRTGTAVVEEFKEGMEVSADFYVQDGKAIYLSATSSLKIRNRNSFTIMSSVYPVVDVRQEEQITQVASQIASAFGLDNCPLLIQMIVGKDGVNVIEFSARMGGGSKYHLIKVLSGVDIMSSYVDLILGGRPSVAPSPQVRYCRMNYIYCTPGIMDKVTGLEELKVAGVIGEYFMYKSAGTVISASATSGDRAAGYLVTADTEDELMRKIALVEASVMVLTPDGKDIMIHNLV